MLLYKDLIDVIEDSRAEKHEMQTTVQKVSKVWEERQDACCQYRVTANEDELCYQKHREGDPALAMKIRDSLSP